MSGIPSGSVLGQVLFSLYLYINDITDNISSHIPLFADDSVIYREINTQQDHSALQEDLDNLCKWQTFGNLALISLNAITLE